MTTNGDSALSQAKDARVPVAHVSTAITAIETLGAHRAYRAGMGASEWEAFLTREEWEALASLRAAEGGAT